ncbi:hypothetical protein [Georgenia sp. AZ-5]|uniref:hypothetical protein n=1 Tax=Georgenia sp. AZ-5 TaxID=3367526 RepID=UPI0037550F95
MAERDEPRRGRRRGPGTPRYRVRREPDEETRRRSAKWRALLDDMTAEEGADEEGADPPDEAGSGNQRGHGPHGG